ncbi:hypothetical protein RUND412_007982 [Rhizina undulata]
MASNTTVPTNTKMSAEVLAPEECTASGEIFTDEVAQSIVEFWYDGHDMGNIKLSDPIFQRWFATNEEFDSKCRDKFGDLLEKITANTSTPALKTQLTSLATTPIRALALHILVDQIPRNLFRGDLTAVVYTRYDPLALHLSLYCTAPERRLDLGPDGSWSANLACRMWFYLPMGHAEDVGMHKLGLKFFEELQAACEETGPEAVEMMKEFIVFVKEHRDIIARFGRYPYRNKILGRENTEEETKWLADPGIDWAR